MRPTAVALAPVLLGACLGGAAAPAGEDARGPGPDAGADSAVADLGRDGARPLRAGDPCPEGIGCTAPLNCYYSSPADEMLCTVPQCDSLADCEEAGFTGGCCMRPPANSNQGFALCIPRRLAASLCPPIGFGEPCPPDSEGCAEGLACTVLRGIGRRCTIPCDGDAACVGLDDACCMPAPAGQGFRACTPRAQGPCE